MTPAKLGAVGRIEPPGERLAVTARRGQRVRRQRVGAPGAVDEYRRLQAASAGERLEGIAALVGECAGLDLVALGRAHEAAGREHDRHRLVRDEAGLVDRLRRLALDDLGAPLVAVLLGIGADLGWRSASSASPCSSSSASISARSVASAFCSSRIFISSSLARWRRRVLRISSVCSSESLKRFISTGFGSSSRRMMRITSSRLRKAISRPSRMCSRRVDLVEAVLQAPRARCACGTRATRSAPRADSSPAAGRRGR